MEEVNEKSTKYLSLAFKDEAGAPVAPASIAYRVDCLTTGAAIRASTPVSPAASITIELTPTDNTIQNAANILELRRVTVTATYGGTKQDVRQFDYALRNLSHAS